MKCENCGAEFEPSRYLGKRQRFCSTRCNQEWRRAHVRPHTFTCQHCGKEYQTLYLDRNKFCSRECAFAHRDRNRPENVAKRETKRQEREAAQHSVARCTECGAEFVKRHGRITCSEECMAVRHRRKYAEYATKRKEQEPRQCKGCGKLFVPIYGDKRRVFCSRACCEKHQKHMHPEWAARDRRMRRAYRFGNGPVERIDPREIFERDGWICGICGKRVSQRYRAPHPLSASLDHIIPLARGGTHTRDNVQLAHFICNSYKGAGGAGQLRLGMG